MTTSQFLAIRCALLSASILVETRQAKATSEGQAHYYRHVARKIDAGLRAMDAIENERTDQPKQKRLDEKKVAS